MKRTNIFGLLAFVAFSFFAVACGGDAAEDADNTETTTEEVTEEATEEAAEEQ